MATINSAFESSLCSSTFDGLWTYWLCLFCISSCLFFSLACLSVLWQYFNPLYWNLDLSIEYKTDDPEHDTGIEMTNKNALTDADAGQDHRKPSAPSRYKTR